MSVKKLLGLESFPIRDSEIMRQIKEARRKKQEVVEFTSGKKKVVVKLTQIGQGIMRDHQEYYNA